VRAAEGLEATPLITLVLRAERDVVAARQRSLQIARLLGFDAQDQVRIATAVSEIARNVINYATEGGIAFSVRGQDRPPALEVEIADHGPGIPDVARILTGRYKSSTGLGLGIVGARRLMDGFEIESGAGRGTRVWLRKALPPGAPPVVGARLVALTDALARGVPDEPSLATVQLENQELLRAMDELRRRREEVERLNREIEETNRGVLALYAELDEKAEHLRRADEMKSRFLSHMSHEFRTPLNSILAISRMLQEHSDGDLNGEQDKQVTFIRKAALDLSELVNDLLDLARVEAGKTVVRTTEFDAGRMLGALRGMMRPLLVSDAVRLVIEEPPAGLPPLLSDEAKVSQILRNFVSNAIKFTERGEVRLSVSMAPDANEVAFAVSDTGIGIDTGDQARIFQEFAQIDGPVQRKVKGTGLGLALSRKLAELLGGRITLESVAGRGSTFTLWLPLEQGAGRAAAVTERVAAVEPPPARAATVLIVDDDPASRYALARLLAGPSIEVAEAVNGADALQRIRATRPSAVVLDLVMPGLGGLEVLAAMRADAALRDVPTVVATSKVLSDEERTQLGRWRVPVFPKSALGRPEAHHEVREALRRAGWIGA
jgi:signal transduction histidine kinase/CheY-like chemotaxis protein